MEPLPTNFRCYVRCVILCIASFQEYQVSLRLSRDMLAKFDRAAISETCYMYTRQETTRSSRPQSARASPQPSTRSRLAIRIDTRVRFTPRRLRPAGSAYERYSSCNGIFRGRCKSQSISSERQHSHSPHERALCGACAPRIKARLAWSATRVVSACCGLPTARVTPPSARSHDTRRHGALPVPRGHQLSSRMGSPAS